MPNYGCRWKIGIVGFDENLTLGCFFPRNRDPELNFLSYSALIAFLPHLLPLPPDYGPLCLSSHLLTIHLLRQYFCNGS